MKSDEIRCLDKHRDYSATSASIVTLLIMTVNL